MDLYQKTENQIDKIEAELKRLGRWQSETIAADAFVDMGAFGSNTMAFEQWLQFVLVPRVRGIIAEKGTFPAGSMVATYAVKNLSGDAEDSNLLTLLSEFDALFE